MEPDNNTVAMSDQDKVIEFLKSEGSLVPTLKIAKAIHGPKATCKLINPLLYTMMSKGIVAKEAGDNGKNPHWKIVAQ